MQLGGGLSYFYATFSPQFSPMVKSLNLISQIWVKIGPCRRQDHCVFKSQIHPRVSEQTQGLFPERGLFTYEHVYKSHGDLV